MGRAHGLDGSFYVDAADVELLREGAELTVAGRTVTVVRRAGTDARPLIGLSGVDDRAGAQALRDEELSAPGAGGADDEPEWDVADLVGCQVPGIGAVRRVLPGPSCDVLEVGEDAVLVPFVSDAVRRVDTDARVIEVDLRFMGLEDAGS